MSKTKMYKDSGWKEFWFQRQLKRIAKETTKALRAGFTMRQILSWACTQVFTVCEDAEKCGLEQDWQNWLEKALQGHPEIRDNYDEDYARAKTLRRIVPILAGLDFIIGLKSAGIEPRHNHLNKKKPESRSEREKLKDPLEEAFEELEEELVETA